MSRLVILSGICLLFPFFSGWAQQRSAQQTRLLDIVNHPSLRGAHLGVSVFDPATKTSVFNYQGDKYFVPASNVKIVTCYAALKQLGDSLPGIRYYENDTALYLVPTGDPTLLHRDFPVQPVIDFLQRQQKHIYVTELNWRDRELGRGWSWDDYNDEYMVERNLLPVYGNTIKWVQQRIPATSGSEPSVAVYSDPEVNWKVGFAPDPSDAKFKVQRDRLENVFRISEGREWSREQIVPFITYGLRSSLELLEDTVGKSIRIKDDFLVLDPEPATIRSQPLDSVLRPMMYDSDNFFAEQLLLMVSQERTGVMSDEEIIDTLLAAELSDLPQQPVWVDGSGLSRYNLFTPQSFVAILEKMRTEFGMEKIKAVFPSGDSGTLRGYYRPEGRHIFAKTGSMSGVVALSGYVYTKRNRLLAFSFLINNYTGKTAAAKRLIERFVRELRND